ncbi:GTPase Era [Cyclobacterium marinum]|uniref:GTPase Era n=1 Tax=Cyclobacterium marinum (strain ATCC 25205 / DSM 745 / LMG 13164 / NCIMB 1802) TaxID=880070 RepID=G0J6Q9_CYCMS|nr:GTPase Era [Cyclobacterium marinum]AEL26107.1 GTP-binding protein Era-like-protein [Cyclobacterium marinum DSM 745]MBI0399464.1 GTPase Era [Cyclobacterium marinum]MBR9777049.1 GTPase Era [Cytophagales bacterium]|tara:strand:+ start:659 stop:1549 length:891 start_codon:yes stop_codon:yes gene_type:complete
MSENTHKAGFVNIIGKPNVGKSTLMNALLGEKLSIISSKAQTTRHRILGIMNEPEYQIVFSDTPGMLKPKYELHKSMMGFVNLSLEDADVIVFVTDLFENDEEIEDIIKKINAADVPVLLIINKIDLNKEEKLAEVTQYWTEKINADIVIPISALEGFNLQKILQEILDRLPVHPPFYDKEELSDRPERFFASEIVREKIFIQYKKEIPYSTEVRIEDFEETENLIRMRAVIFVERDSQKGIIIGDKGKALKRVGTQARIEMEKFFGKKVFLETFVKVEDNWRKNKNKLRKFGYDQ